MNKQTVVYISKNGAVELDVPLDQETVWLTQKQMAELFGKDVKTVNQHIRHIYEEGELEQNSTISKSEIVQNESGMVALALLVAESNPQQKDLMIRLIINLITSSGVSC